MSKLIDIFRDRNDINEKVIVGYISFCIMVIFAILDIVSSYLGKELLVHQFIFDAFLYLTLGSFGISSVDKFTNKRNSHSDRNEPVDDNSSNEQFIDPRNDPANMDEPDPNR
jgi:hypothetical protein